MQSSANRPDEDEIKSGNAVGVGSHVEVELIDRAGAAESLSFDLAPEGKGDFDAGFVAANTPLAQAVLGRCEGDVVDYHVGDIVQVRIRRVTASTRTPPGDAEAKGQAVIQAAVKKSDLLDAVRFSLTVDQKWGDTDPQVMAENWDQDPT